jgi:hypothetical protein
MAPRRVATSLKRILAQKLKIMVGFQTVYGLNKEDNNCRHVSNSSQSLTKKLSIVVTSKTVARR